jgi:hypothetical protein
MEEEGKDRKRKGWKDGRRGKKVQNDERKTIEHKENGGSKMRETERKEREEILNKDLREIRWMTEIWKRRERTEKERGGGQK